MSALPISLLHFGKTGGTYLKSIIRAQGPQSAHIRLLTHRQKLGRDFQGPFAFVFREPAARFVSGFHSRRRMGRPLNTVIWSTEEAVAFSHFSTANALAEALYCTDDLKMSAAHFAMSAIRHLRYGYAHCFGTITALNAVADDLVFAVDLEELDAELDRILNLLGLANAVIPDDLERHENPDPPEVLSEVAQVNLAMFWEKEFAFYRQFQKLALAAR